MLPYMRVENVQDGKLDLSDIQTIELLESERERFLLRTGDFLLGRVNTNECIGDQREMNEEHENAIQFVESGEDTAKAL
jgi:type I restriction enzyme S subunit